jgi:DNA repair protein RadC
LNLKIKEWSESDRPREKLLLKGKEALSEAELLAILIGSGTKSLSAVELCKQILKSSSNNLNELAKLSVNELMKFKGIGQAKAIAIVAALELGRRRKETELTKKEKISCSKDVYDCMKPHLLDLRHEEFWIILLNRANEVVKKIKIGIGGISNIGVDPKFIFSKAIENYASSIVLVHNHPSGNLKPSKEDIELTHQLQKGGEILHIQIVDHVIFCTNGYYSFLDNDLL